MRSRSRGFKEGLHLHYTREKVLILVYKGGGRENIINLLAAVFYVVVLEMLWLKLVMRSFVALIVRAKSARFTVKHLSEG